MDKTKLLFPKDAVKEAGFNGFPVGTSTISLSLPAGQDKEWKWSNGKNGFIFRAESEKGVAEGVCSAGQFVGTDIVKDGHIESPFTCVRTSRHISFKSI
jgi:hypothetical protein